jgi:hypothetical protein
MKKLRLRLATDPRRFAAVRDKAVVLFLLLALLLFLGHPAQWWWQRLMLLLAIPTAWKALRNLLFAIQLRPLSLREELEWRVSPRQVQLRCLRDGEQSWRQVELIPEGCTARPGFVFRDHKPDGSGKRYEVFIELHCPDGVEKRKLLDPSETLHQLDKQQVIQLVEMLGEALGVNEETREQTDPWKQQETIPSLFYRQGDEHFVLQGRSIRFGDILSEHHYSVRHYTYGSYVDTTYHLNLSLRTGERLRVTVKETEPEAVQAWQALTPALDQWLLARHRQTLADTGETVFTEHSLRVVFTRGKGGLRMFVEQDGRRTQVAKVLAYKSLDRPVFVFVDQNGMKIAVQPGSFDEQEGLFALMEEAGVPMVLLDHSPMLSLWLRAKGFRTDGEHPVQAIFYRFFRRLWWRALVPLALLYYALFSGALMVQDEVTHRYLTPAEKWFGLSAPDWLDIPVVIILLALSWYLLVWIGSKIGKS